MLRPLFFLILSLLAIAFAPPGSKNPWPLGFFSALLFLSSLYIVLVSLLLLLRKVKFKSFEPLGYGLCCLYLLLFLYVTSFQRFFSGMALFYTFTTLVAFFLFWNAIASFLTWRKALFYLPFAFPFFIYALAEDLFHPSGAYEGILFFVLAAFSLLFLLPISFKWVWNCKPLPSSELKSRLDLLCARCHFSHGGMKIWNALPYLATAAIVGLLPRYRYILFTPMLLRQFPDEEIEAIVAHEMGHSKLHHLIYLPCILLGALPLAGILATYSASISPLYFYFLNGCLLIAYLRLVYGYFSRCFEREADLYCLQIHLPGESMISALKRLAHVHHIPLNYPSWHHGSLKERIEAIQKVMEDPLFLQKEKRRIKVSLILYACYLIITFSIWIL